MLNSCGKQVKDRCESSRNHRGRLSTYSKKLHLILNPVCGKGSFLHDIFPGLFPQYSTVYFTDSSLSEHYLYPFSTVPIIKTTNFNSLER